ncbi:MAG: hypothetical protein JW909_02925 [Planctomycetes bacterium]|nr:hypothetical protein [Planctomycetota bacterium]
MADLRRFVGIVLFMGLAGTWAAAEDVPTFLTFGDTPLKIVIKEWDADGFTFVITDTNSESELKWYDVPESEASRIQKLLGMGEEEETQSRTGETVVGESIWLTTSRKPIVGVVKPSPSPDYIVLDTASVKGFKIRVQDIKRREARTIYLDSVYSPEEIYAQKLDSKPPRSAQEHYEFAIMCQGYGLYQEAKGHLEIAQALDERYKERVAERIKELDDLIEKQSAETLAKEAKRAISAGKYDDALDIINKVKEFYGEDPVVLDLVAIIPEIEKKKKESIRRNVISSYYSYHDQFVRKIATGMISEGSELPGKLVYLKEGRSIKGMLESETPELLILKNDNREYRIEKTAIAEGGITDINLNTKKRKPSFDECRAYVTDPKGGITADILAAIAKAYNITTDEADEVWQDRLKETYVLKRGGSVIREASYTSLRSVSYGHGVWLRAGGSSSGVRTVGNAGNSGRGGSSSGSTTLETDPEKWWNAQPESTRVQLLTALSVEALFHVVSTDKIPCPQCGGKGATQSIGTQGTIEGKLCSYCRGLGHTIRLKYK